MAALSSEIGGQLANGTKLGRVITGSRVGRGVVVVASGAFAVNSGVQAYRSAQQGIRATGCDWTRAALEFARAAINVLNTANGIRSLVAGLQSPFSGGSGAPETPNVPLATDAPPGVPANESSPLLDQIRGAGGTLPVGGPDVPIQDIAQASRAGGNEIALYQDQSGQYFLTEGSPTAVDVPADSNLLLHVQPGDGPLSVVPSTTDRAALQTLGQNSSTIINSAGTYKLDFGPTNELDGEIEPIGG